MKVGCLILFDSTPKFVTQALHHPPTREICELALERLANGGHFNEVQEVATTFMRGQQFHVLTPPNSDQENRYDRHTTCRAINDRYVQRQIVP